MRIGRRYLVAVALLAFLAVVFGLAGGFSAASHSVEPQQVGPSPSVTHFIYPPTFDTGWLNIVDFCGQTFTLDHELNTMELIVDITGKTTSDSSAHQKYYGGTNPTPSWQKTYGGTGADGASCMVQTGDEGYALAGNGFANLVKIDSSGSQQWSKTYGGNGRCVVKTGDGGYALAGFTGDLDFWLVKTDPDGNKEWSKTYAGPSYDYAYSLVQTLDGGYALAGTTYSETGNYDVWLVKADSAGNHQWNKTYGGTNWEEARSLIQTADGGYALAGFIYYGAEYYDFYLVKTDLDGNMEWQKIYWGVGDERAYSVVQTLDGGYALAGFTNSYGAGGCDFWLVKTNSTGYMQWNKAYGGTAHDRAYSLVQTVDGGYALAGHTYSYGLGASNFWLVKTDSAGTKQWTRTYGGVNDDQAVSLVHTGDGGYAMAGWTDSSGAGSQDFWLVKTDTENGLAWTDSTPNTLTMYRGKTDPYWNYVRVRIWTIQEPTWQYGDINQDGKVDIQDLYILSRNYGKTFSLLSLSGIIAIAGIQTYKTRKKPKQDH